MSSRLPAPLLILGAAALWGTTGTAQALAPDAAAPAAVGAVRLVGGGALLAALALRSGPRRRAVRGPLLLPALVGAVGVAAYQLAFFSGVARAGVALGTVVAIGSAPVVTGALARVVRGERPEPGWTAATALAVAGVVLLLAPAGGVRPDPLGLLLAVGAGAAYAVYTLASKALLDAGLGPDGAMGAVFGGGAVLLAVGLPFLDVGWVPSARGALVAVWLVVATVVVAYVLFGRGLARLPTSTVASLSLAEPLTAALLGVLALGERPGPIGLVGAGLVLAGLLVLARRPVVQAE